MVIFWNALYNIQNNSPKRYKMWVCSFMDFSWTSLGLLSFYHIYRMVIDYGGWKLDVSTIMM